MTTQRANTQRQFAVLTLAVLAMAACQEPSASGQAVNTPPTRAQSWSICQDPNRGMAAVEACTALLQSDQESRQSLTYVHYNRGLALSRRGRALAAIDDFDAALALDPSFALGLYQRGLAYQSLGQQIRADQDLRRARQLNPRLP